MASVSISQLKINPAAAIAQSVDYPVAVENRNTIQAYLIGKNLYEKLVAFIEDQSDKAAVKNADFTKGRDLEAVARDLGI